MFFASVFLCYSLTVMPGSENFCATYTDQGPHKTLELCSIRAEEMVDRILEIISINHGQPIDYTADMWCSTPG